MKIISRQSKNKKSGRPTQPGNRSTAPETVKAKQKRRPILYRIVRFCKHVYWDRVAVLVLALIGAICLICLVCGAIFGASDKPVEPEKPEPTVYEEKEEAPAGVAEIPKDPQGLTIEFIFKNGDGYPVDVQSLTNTWAAVTGYEKRYELTDSERWEVASVVTAEAKGEPYAGMVAVAQCILQACEDEGIRPYEAVRVFSYTGNRPQPTEEALRAVQAVFDFGQVVTDKPIKYFYAPALTYSEWHETQEHVLTINGHKFFAEVE